MSNLRALRKRAGLTLTELAERVGTSAPQISRLETGERKLTKEWADRIAPELDCLPQDLLFGQPAGLAAPPQSPYSIGEPSNNAMPVDVPVYAAVFDADGQFSKLNDEPVNYIQRLPRIAHAKGVFALYVENDSMVPRFDQGDILYINPAHPPKSGDYVLIELRTTAGLAGDGGYIKRLVSQTSGISIVKQFNPPKQFPLDHSAIKSMFRIIPWNELAGA